MKRALMITAALLVFVVGLAVAQDAAPKPEPKFYAGVHVALVLAKDSDEAGISADLNTIVAALRADMTIITRWSPASTSRMRASEIERSKTFKRAIPLTRNAKTSTFSALVDVPITVAQGQSAQTAFMSLASDPRVESFSIGLNFQTEPRQKT